MTSRSFSGFLRLFVPKSSTRMYFKDCERILTLLVESRNGPNAVIRKCAEDLNDGFLVSAHSGNGVMEFLGVKVR